MDIQKERELLKLICKMDDDLVDCEDLCVNEKWILMGARAVKAQAVPEGFGDIQSWIEVNSFSALDAVHENVPIIDANELAKYIDSLIEAQELAND